MTNGVTILGRVTLMVVVALFLCACGSSGNNLEKLHGKWQMDKKATVELSKEFGKMSKEMKAELIGRLGQHGLEFDVFAKDILFVFDNATHGTLRLPFEVKKDSGDTISISVNREQPTKITFEKDNIIIVDSSRLQHVTGIPEMVFVKVK